MVANRDRISGDERGSSSSTSSAISSIHSLDVITLSFMNNCNTEAAELATSVTLEVFNNLGELAKGSIRNLHQSGILLAHGAAAARALMR